MDESLRCGVDFCRLREYNGVMVYKSIEEIAAKWGLSKRTVRDYCAKGRVEGAKMTGGIWRVPEDAVKPERINRADNEPTLLEILRRENKLRLRGGIYHKVQVELTYNSNHMEGSRLTKEQTRYIFETNTVGVLKKYEGIRVDDVSKRRTIFGAWITSSIMRIGS